MLRASVGLSASSDSLPRDRAARTRTERSCSAAMRAKTLVAQACDRARAVRSARRWRDRSSRAPSPCSTARCGRTASGRASPAGARAAPRRRPIHSSIAVPTPYQPGSMMRAWLHENTHGIARRSSMRPDAVRDAGPAADVELGDLVDRRRGAEPVDEARRLVDELAVDAPAGGGQLVEEVVVRRPRVVTETFDVNEGGLDASRPASLRGLRRAWSGSAYFAATTSPCSVIRNDPSTRLGLGEDRLVARTAAAADGAAATVEQPQAHARARASAATRSISAR